MIVSCTECDTQFRLDDSKVAGTGLNVRCSICKHAFFVPAPGAEVDDTATDPAAAFDRVAGAAAEAAFSDVPSPTPEVTRDLAAPDSDASIDDEDEIATTIAPSRAPGSLNDLLTEYNSAHSSSGWSLAAAASGTWLSSARPA